MAAQERDSAAEPWLLDLDGTLVDSMGRFHEAFAGAVRDAAGTVISREEFVGGLVRGTLLAHVRDPAMHDAVWADVARRFAGSSVPCELIPGARDALELLRRHSARVGVVTARVTQPRAVARDLAALGVGHLVDLVLTFASLPAGMPAGTARDDKTRLFEAACQAMSVRPGQAHYVTDWPDDARSAARFGFKSTTGVLTGGYRREHFPDTIPVAADVLAAVQARLCGHD